MTIYERILADLDARPTTRTVHIAEAVYEAFRQEQLEEKAPIEAAWPKGVSFTFEYHGKTLADGWVLHD